MITIDQSVKCNSAIGFGLLGGVAIFASLFNLNRKFIDVIIVNMKFGQLSFFCSIMAMKVALVFKDQKPFFLSSLSLIWKLLAGVRF